MNIRKGGLPHAHLLICFENREIRECADVYQRKTPVLLQLLLRYHQPVVACQISEIRVLSLFSYLLTKDIAELDRAQKVGVQAITGAFKSAVYYSAKSHGRRCTDRSR